MPSPQRGQQQYNAATSGLMALLELGTGASEIFLYDVGAG
jgi:hypothetical protein